MIKLIFLHSAGNTVQYRAGHYKGETGLVPVEQGDTCGRSIWQKEGRHLLNPRICLEHGILEQQSSSHFLPGLASAKQLSNQYLIRSGSIHPLVETPFQGSGRQIDPVFGIGSHRHHLDLLSAYLHFSFHA